MTSIGKIRRLQQCATPAGKFVMLALDHRNNLRRSLNPADPDSVTYGQIVAFKQQVAAELAPRTTAILLDPEFGAAQCIAADVIPGQVGLLVTVEATGYSDEPTARRSQILPGWSVAKVARMGGAGVKLLIYYHPEARNAAEQEALVYEIGQVCQAYDIPLFLEPLSFSIDPAVKKLPPAERRAVVLETARRLTPAGVDVLKAEFPLDVAAEPDEAGWAEACAELSAASAVPGVLLSAGVTFAQFERQTAVACRNGASGVLVGRAVWQEAADLPAAERGAFLRITAAERMQRLTDIISAYARPWTDMYPNLPESIDEDWYKQY